MSKRFGYFYKDENGKIKHAISRSRIRKTSLDAYYKQLKILFNLLPLATSFETVRSNLDSINKHHELCVKKLINSPTDHLFFIDKEFDQLKEATKNINNYLSSVSSYLTVMTSIVMNEFGKNSLKFNEWDLYRKKLHEDNFSYRFCYQLRNYSQHGHLPVDTIHYSVSNYTINSQYSVSFTKYKDTLLSSNYDWNNNYKSELETHNGDFDLIPILTDYFSCVQKLFKKYTALKDDNLKQLINYLNKINNDLNVPENYVLVIFNNPSLKSISSCTEDESLEYEVVPLPQVKWLTKIFSGINNDY